MPVARRTAPRRSATPSRPLPARTEAVEFFPEVEQRDEAWYRLRLGMVTASNAAAVLATSEEMRMRTGLLYRLAGEILTETPAETFSNAAMERGRDMEPAARAHFEFTRAVTLEPMGFVKRTITDPVLGSFSVGCSPDSVQTARRRVLEIKTMAPHLMLELLESGRQPKEFKAQCQFSLWVTGYDVCDLLVYYEGMPVSPSFELPRDGPYIDNLAREVERFQFDLDTLVKRTRERGR